MFGLTFNVARAKDKYQDKAPSDYGIFNQYIKGSL
jgi:hypothetical protein